MSKSEKTKFSVSFYDVLNAILLTNFILSKIFTNKLLKLEVFSVKLSLALKNVKIRLFSQCKAKVLIIRKLSCLGARLAVFGGKIDLVAMRKWLR